MLYPFKVQVTCVLDLAYSHEKDRESFMQHAELQH